MTYTQSSRSPTPIDYGQLGDATAAAIRREGVGSDVIDYDRMGDAVARANMDAGVGTAVIDLSGREFGSELEPYTSRAARERTGRSVKGRTGRMMLV